MNNTKALPIVLGVVIIILLAILIFVPGRNTTVAPTATSTETGTNPTVSTSTTEAPGPSPTATLYAYKSTKGKAVNAYLAPNSTIISPLTLTGNVPAGWAFEASFPAQLLDGTGKVIGQGIARVPNWMSTTTAWYAVSVSFSKPATATGTLVLKNDNASGLPQNDDEVRIPVKF